MTCGLCSGGSFLEAKRAAIEKFEYPVGVTYSEAILNHDEIRVALDAALDPLSELYKQAQARCEHLPPKIAEWIIAGEIAGPVTEALSRQPEFMNHQNLMIAHDNGSIGFRPSDVAPRLIIRAKTDGSAKAVIWIEKILGTSRAAGCRVMPLWGIACEEPRTLASGVDLLPFGALPQSGGKTWVENPSERHLGGMGLLPGFQLAFSQPSSALVAHIEIEPLLFDASAPPVTRDPQRVQQLLDNVRLCLTAIGPSPVLGPIHWFQFDDPDFDAVSMGGIFGSLMEILPMSLPPTQPLDLEPAQRLVPRYLNLTGRARDRVTVSLQRLGQAMLRRTLGDRAADLSIALETLLVDDRGEHRWKVSTRAAMITGWDLSSKLRRRRVVADAYDMRSSLMHSGTAGDKASGETCDEAVRICAAVIRAIIEHGGIPSWPDFDVSGGTCGWPP